MSAISFSRVSWLYLSWMIKSINWNSCLAGSDTFKWSKPKQIERQIMLQRICDSLISVYKNHKEINPGWK